MRCGKRAFTLVISATVPFRSTNERGVNTMLDKEKYITKKYLHFDHRVKIDNAERYITNPKKIARHSFLPLIRYDKKIIKRIDGKNPEANNRPIKIKNREIMYAGHWDNFIYKYYADMINGYYNAFCCSNNIDECVTAYRNNKQGKSNIDFAAEIINGVFNMEAAYVLVGDFTNYFSNLNHQLLKENIKHVMNTDKLSADWYNVFRSITKYGYYDKLSLIKDRGTDKTLKLQGEKSYFKKVKCFREYQKEKPTLHNKNDYGIPQGSAISAIFANIYAIDFDLKLKAIADNYSGIYRRYSDDFILILPKKSVGDIQKLEEIEFYIRKQASIHKISLQEEKTGLYAYENMAIKNIHDSNDQCLDYLGFVFDGKTVRMRAKSTYKFYRKAKKLVTYAFIVRKNKELKKLPYRKKLYNLYTDYGVNHGRHGNFISYALRAQEKFDAISPGTRNLMASQIKNRKKKIERLIKGRII